MFSNRDVQLEDARCPAAAGTSCATGSPFEELLAHDPSENPKSYSDGEEAMSILDPRIETASRDAIRQTQLERLQATVNRVYKHVRYYRQVFDANGVQPEDIRTLGDLTRIPFTTRADLLAHQPYDMFAVSLRDVLRLHPAAGAGGPVVVGYTENDIATWTRMAARALASADIHKEDVLQIDLNYASNAAALGTQSAAEMIGASILPTSGLSPGRQVEVMRQYRATVLVATPSQALQLGHVDKALAPASLALRVAFIVGEVWSDELRETIESLLQVKAFGSYGLPEMAVPGLATECEHHCGLHLTEGNVFAEAIDPSCGQTLPPGETGELVLTTLTREGTPLLRYRTGDLTTLDYAGCACGRTMVRMAPTHSRSDDMVIVNGTRFTAAQVEDVIHAQVPSAPCRVVVSEIDGRDTVEVEIGAAPSLFDDEMRRMQAIREALEAAVLEYLGLNAVVRLVHPDHVLDGPELIDTRRAQ